MNARWCVAVLLMTPALVPAAADAAPTVAAGATCAGHRVTIDLNDAHHPDPHRPQSDVVMGTWRRNKISTGAGNDIVCGLGHLDKIDLGPGDDEAYGGHGPDVLFGGTGDDYYVGGQGEDMINFGHATQRTTIDLRKQGWQETGWGRDKLEEIEDIRGARRYENRLIGDSGPNYVVGGDVRDWVKTLGGRDEISGRSVGVSRLDAGDGSDYVYGSENADLIIGGDGDDNLNSRGGTDVMMGGGGDDALIAEEWDASPLEIHGGPGDDLLYAATEDDLLDGGDGVDLVDFGTTPGSIDDVGVTVDLALVGPQDTVTFGMDEFIDIEVLEGTVYDDVLLGDDRDNKLYGSHGSDHIDGRGGNDFCDGGGILSDVDELLNCEN
ncbi:calcium-binding protein [Nocardioides humilatus]|uniref:calcium-binding protein n=1 Tax=Nocardioides humilatus TaxID=2607660 RepID=UPI00165F51CB|nr:calcium-binding protein [Nocardioides humilatus]